MRRLGSAGLLSLWTVICLLAGCSSSPPPKPNLRPSAISVVTPVQDIQASHRLDVRVGIVSATALEGVGVAFRAFPRAQYDARVEDIENWVLGSSAHDVAAGEGTFDAQLQIPYEVPAGEYYLVPEVDPQDTIEETDETDQYGPRVLFVVRDEHREHPRLMVEGGVLDVPAFELAWVLGAPPEPLGLTLLVRAEGSAPVQDAELTACVRGPDTGCVAMPLGVWDSAAGRHLPQLVVPELLPGEPTSVHLDLAFGPELAAVFVDLLGRVQSACLANVTSCAATYGMVPACVEGCLEPFLADPAHADPVALQACLLKCLPFTVEATIGKPGATLFEPTIAAPGRTHAVDLQLIAPPPPDPAVPQALAMGPLVEPVARPVSQFGFWIWSPPSIEFAADKGTCAEPVLWSVELAPDQPAGAYTSPGTIAGTDLAAIYVPPLPSSPDARTTKVVVAASACGETASSLVTLIGRDPSLLLEPARLAVTAGAEGTVELRAIVTDCVPPNPPVEWELIASSPRLDAGPGFLAASPDPMVTGYAPPPSITMGPPVEVTLRARAPACGVEGTATIAVGLAEKLGFEKAYAKQFANDLFGAGVDLYAGGGMDRAGGSADGHVRIPVRIFGQDFNLLDVTDHASVDPRPAGERHFLHRIDAFGFTVNSMHCPGDPICSGTADIWSQSKCKPDGPPPMCVGSPYAAPCKRSTDCTGAGLRCMDGFCTKKCDGAGDCPGGACLGSLAPGPYKKVFVIVVVPVTVEGKICVDYGIEARLNLLEPVPGEFSATLGPFVEVGGYASAAVGYAGLLALGVRGEIVLLRDDFYGKTSASIQLVPQGASCPYAAGCIQGALREGVENVLEGGKGRVFLFADYPTLRWCRWYPCIGTAQARKTLVSWGPLFQVANRCDWCATAADCPLGVPCVGGMCDDGFPGLLCRQQSAFVSAE